MDFSKIPFTVYDFFGYLASGFLIILGFPCLPPWLLIKLDNMKLPSWIFLIIVAYVLGHVLSSLSKWLYELIIVRTFLKLPCINLLKPEESKVSKKASKKLFKVIFPEYSSAFPERVRKEILKDGCADANKPRDEEIKALFDEAYASVKTNKDALSRLDTFLILYGFCRTVSLTLLILGSAFLFRHNLMVGIVGICLAIIMFLRYLKFIRQHSYELFLSYIKLRQPGH